MINPKESISLDRAGVCASMLCMVHCILVPVLFVLGVDSIIWMIDQEWIELTFIGLSLTIGLISFLGGYVRHKQHFVPVLFVAGFLLLVNGEAVSSLWLAMSLSVAGATVIAYAHIQNIKWKNHASAR